MKLYDNPESKIIYASDNETNRAMQEITSDKIAALVADGYTIDVSAVCFAREAAPVSGEFSSDVSSGAAAPALTDTGTSAASEGDAPLPVTSALPSGSVGSVTSDTGEVASGESGEAVPDTSGTASASTLSIGTTTTTGSTSSDALSKTGEISALSGSTDSSSGSPLVSGAATGTTAAITQTGDQQVVTGLTQSSNSLAGTEPATGNQLVNSTSTVDAPALDGDSKTVTNVENDLNPLVPANELLDCVKPVTTC